MGNIDMRNIDMRNIDMRNIDMRNIDMRNIDMSNIDCVIILYYHQVETNNSLVDCNNLKCCVVNSFLYNGAPTKK